MITITLMIMTLSMGYLIGRNLKIIHYEIKIEKVIEENKQLADQIFRLRSHITKPPPWKEKP